MQTAMFMIWNRVTDSISHDNNYYTVCLLPTPKIYVMTS